MDSNRKQQRPAVIVARTCPQEWERNIASVEKEVDCNKRPRCSLRSRVYLTLACGD